MVATNKRNSLSMVEHIRAQAIAEERERCAKICDEGAEKFDGDTAAVLMTTADLIRNPVE